MIEKQLEISLAENLNRLITERHWTINLTAKKIGMSKSTLHNYCCGIFPKNLQSLKDLADLFGISLNELILGDKKSEEFMVQRFSIDGGLEIFVRRKNNILPRGLNFE